MTRVLNILCLLMVVHAAIDSLNVFAYFQEGAYGVRPAGMGEAFVSLADDANAVMYNAASRRAGDECSPAV
jgi:hypothetical protein